MRPGRAELVLVGGGHAHVQVLRQLAMRPVDARVRVVLDRSLAVYSGMVPGLVAGDYRAHELEIDVLPLARRARAGVVLAAATGIDPQRRRIELEGRPPLTYDVASLDVGSTVRGLELPGVREHALATRPIGAFVRDFEARLFGSPPGREPLRIAVVGGGAAGVELALTLDARCQREGRSREIQLLFEGPELLPGASPAMARRARAEARSRGLALDGGARVVAVEKGGLRLARGDWLDCDLVVWATGAAPHRWLADSPLPADERGFVRVGPGLQVVGHPELFAVGDCAGLEVAPGTPKAGVYAVRQGPVLADNLRARLAGRRVRSYRPQRDFLALLNLGHGRALGAKWGLTAQGASVHRVKDAIDRSFMRRFQVLDRGGQPSRGFPSPDKMGSEPMACGGCASKLGARPLAAALARLPAAPHDPSVRLGLERPDDVAAVAPSGELVLATIDGFRAFCDDPWLVGRVAAVNALGDVFAKGGRPRHALAWVSVPDTAKRPDEILLQALAGVRAALDPLAVSLVGGHSGAAETLSVGLAVLGTPAADAWLRPLDALRPGRALLLSKALGTGVVLAADMRGLARSEWVEAAWASMIRPNADASQLATRLDARSCTDVTGFGLAGHLLEMLEASGVAADLELASLPALPGALSLLARGERSTAHPQNRDLARSLQLDPGVGGPELELLFDPQTSGGLLFDVAPERVPEALAALRAAGDRRAAVVAATRPALAGQPLLRLRLRAPS